MGKKTSPTYRPGLIVLLVIVAILYVILHASRYRNCLFPPSIFDWPSFCL